MIKDIEWLETYASLVETERHLLRLVEDCGETHNDCEEFVQRTHYSVWKLAGFIERFLQHKKLLTDEGQPSDYLYSSIGQDAYDLDDFQ